MHPPQPLVHPCANRGKWCGRCRGQIPKFEIKKEYLKLFQTGQIPATQGEHAVHQPQR